MHNLLLSAQFMFKDMVNIKQGNDKLPNLILPSGHNTLFFVHGYLQWKSLSCNPMNYEWFFKHKWGLQPFF